MAEYGGAAAADSAERSQTVGPTASDVFLQYVTSQVNKGDVYQMVGAQKHMLMRFEKTNEMLLNFNILSKVRFETTQHEFKKHTQLLAEMKIDLDNVFKRIRTLKNTVSKSHPDAFCACSDVYNLVEDEEEDEEEDDSEPLTSADRAAGSDSPRLARQVTVIAANPAKAQPSADSQISSDGQPQNGHVTGAPPRLESEVSSDIDPPSELMARAQPSAQTSLESQMSSDIDPPSGYSAKAQPSAQTSLESQLSSDFEPPSGTCSESDSQPNLSHPNDPQALSLRRH